MNYNRMLKVMSLLGIKQEEDELNYGEHVNGDHYVVTDWNRLERAAGKDKADQVERILRSLNFELAYPDQMTNCDDCNKLVNLHAQSYGDLDVAQLQENGGYASYVCPDCCREAPEDYLEIRIDNPNMANMALPDSQLEELGFIKVQEDLETGFHAGQDDDPQELLEKHKSDNNQVLFSISGVGQFDCRWDVWTRNISDDS